MSTATYNQAIDYFGIESATSDALKVVSSNQNRSTQTATGENTYGDSVAVDAYGDVSAPSAEYECVANLASSALASVLPGTILEAGNGITGNYGIGSITIATQTGSAPKVTIEGQEISADAETRRLYSIPTFTLTPRHRAQDFLGLCTIKKTVDTEADMGTDYGLESVTATFPVEYTLTQAKGDTLNYDLHGGMCTCAFTMNWYANATAPGISLNTSASNFPAGATMTAPRTRSDPENGYTQYTWTVSWPFVGSEYTPVNASLSLSAPPPSGDGDTPDETPDESDGETPEETPGKEER